MSEASLSPKRPRLDYDDNSEKEDRYDKYKNRDREHDEQNNFLQSKSRKRSDPDDDDGKEDDAKSKSINIETARREHTLVMRLTNKEQELQDCMNQIQEMKQAQTQNTAQLRSMLLDPAINLVFQRMAKEMDEHKEKLKQKQNELSAWKFTPDSQTGMRLMAKCRMLLQENGELGKMISSGRTARLEGEIALHKALVTEMKKNQKELDEFLRELDVDVEGMQGMIFMLQQQLKDARDQISRLQQENEQLRTLRHPDPEVGVGIKENSSTPLHSWSPENLERDSKLHASTANSGNSTWSDHGTNSSSPVMVSCPAASSTRNQSDPLAIAQNTEGDFNMDMFAVKVTPDSGMQTQEDEDVSLDTTDFRSSLELQDQQGDSRDSHSKMEQETRMFDPLEESSQEPISSQTGDERTNISISTTGSNKTNDSRPTFMSSSLRETSATCLPIDRTAQPTVAEKCSALLGESLTDGRENCADRTNYSNPGIKDEPPTLSASLETTSERTCLDTVQDDKTALHSSLGLNSLVKAEDDRQDCQSRLGLLNGTSNLPGQGL
ncbi:unnamed protein product [Lymnaea stagnalis]|uniref:Pre-mRNA-splicing regulator WTAP n=1 Tax=Lymnaea stagnalis TaxID=6523 RepID=A0AAV2HML0_LYMST